MDQKDHITLWCHFDNLLWTITALMVTVVGGLMLYVLTHKFNIILATLGFCLTPLFFYLAVSFKENRFIVEEGDEEIRKLLEKRRFIQWLPYLLVFIIIVLTWVGLLMYNSSSLLFRTAWLTAGITVIVIMLSLDAKNKKDKKT